MRRGRRRWTITNSPSPGSWRSAPPSRWPTAATWRAPTPPASPRPAWRSRPTRPRPRATPRAATWWRWSPTAPRCWAWAISARWPSKPVMEGKAVLFKKFANIDCFDIELNESRPGEAGRHRLRAGTDLRRDQPRRHQGAGLLHRRAALPRADEHSGLPRRPARHRHRRRRRGDQCAAGRGQALRATIKVVSTGGGAAGIACLNMLLKLGVKRENVWLCDLAGLVYEGRDERDDAAEGRVRPARRAA